MPSVTDLRYLQLFSGVSEAQMKEFMHSYTTRRFKAGEFIFRSGEGLSCLYLLLCGTVKTYAYSPQGQRQIIHVFYPGTVFGGLLFGEEQEPWAQAASDVMVVVISKQQFAQLMEKFPNVCLKILTSMVDHHQVHVRRMQTLLYRKASDRLMLTLLHLGDLQGNKDSATFVLDPAFTHEDLASMIGVARTTVSERMSDLRRRGIVSGRRGRLEVDRQAAERFLAQQ